MRWLPAGALTLAGILGTITASASELTRVQIAVSVVDGRGRPVTTLAADDFVVTDRGAPTPVLESTFVAPAAGPAAPADPPRGDGDRLDADSRLVALFLDEYHVAPARSADVRAVLRTFLQTQLTPRDRVLVVKPLDPLLDLPLGSAPAAALAAVDAFEGRQGQYEPRTLFERDLIATDPTQVERARTRIAISAIQAVTTRAARAGRGRKAFLIVSEGLAAAAPPRRGAGQPTADAIARVATRGNVAISVFNPAAGGEPADSPPAASVLSELVRQTGGHDLGRRPAAQLEDVVRDLDSYYVVALDGAADGQFHPLTVGVKRRGLQVRTLPGYWAMSPEELARVTRLATPAPPPRPPLPAIRGSRLIVPWVGQQRAAGGRTAMTVVWEPAPARAGDRNRTLPPSHVVVRALLPDGSAIYEGMIQAATSGLGDLAKATFEAPAGRLRLQMSIEDASARVLDTEVREVLVGDWNAGLAFGTPRVFRARTAREFHALQQDPQAVPAPGRSFSRVERLLLRVPVYGGDGGRPAVTAALLNRTGHVMRELTVDPPAAGDGLFMVDLPLAGLAAAEYAVRWRAASGADEALETLTFRVTP